MKPSTLERSAGIPGFLFLFSLLLRAGLISAGPYHLDCVTMARQALATVETGQLHYLHSHGFPLSAMLAASFVYLARLFGEQDPVLAVNAMSVVFSSLCVPVFYLLARRLTGTAAAVFGSVLFSTSPILLGLSVFGNTHTPALFFLLGGMLALVRAAEDHGWTALLFSGLLFGLAGAARLQDMVVALPAALLFLFSPPTDYRPAITKSLQRALTLLAVCGTVITLFYLPLIQGKFNGLDRATVRPFLSWEVTSRITDYAIDYGWRYLTNNFTVMGQLVWIAGLILAFKGTRRTGLFLMTWSLVPALALSSLNIITPRFLTAALPPLYILQGLTLAAFWRYRKPWRTATLLILLALSGLQLTRILPILIARHQRAPLTEFFRGLSGITEPGALVIIGDEGEFLRYYQGPPQIIRPKKGIGPYTTEELAAFKNELDEKLRAGIPVYITNTGLLAYDPGRQFSGFLKHHYQLDLVGRKDYEDWHRGVIYQVVYPEKVYRVRPQPAGSAGHRDP